MDNAFASRCFLTGDPFEGTSAGMPLDRDKFLAFLYKSSMFRFCFELVSSFVVALCRAQRFHKNLGLYGMELLIKLIDTVPCCY